jgi:hypothetical protein
MGERVRAREKVGEREGETMLPRRSSETALHAHHDQQALRRGGSATNLGEEREWWGRGGGRGKRESE